MTAAAAHAQFDDPDDVGDALAAAPRPLLIATDVDGTLSPIVPTPGEARLLPGVAELLVGLAGHEGLHVAVISGRSLAELRDQFGLPDAVHLVGSHGAEVENAEPLDDGEARMLTGVIEHLEQIAADLPGSTVEHKPVAAALHVRNCRPTDAAAGLAHARTVFAGAAQLDVHEGHQVYEVAVRHTTKAEALLALRNRLRLAAAAFLGDDTSDETAFATLRPPDIGVKVGAGETLAHFRVAAPADVVRVLAVLRDRLE